MKLYANKRVPHFIERIRLAIFFGQGNILKTTVTDLLQVIEEKQLSVTYELAQQHLIARSTT